MPLTKQREQEKCTHVTIRRERQAKEDTTYTHNLNAQQYK